MNENLTQAIALVKEWNAGDPAVLAIKIAQALFETWEGAKPAVRDTDLLVRVNRGREIIRDNEGDIWVRRESALDAVAEARREGAREMRERAAQIADQYEARYEKYNRYRPQDLDIGSEIASREISEAIRTLSSAPETKQKS